MNRKLFNGLVLQSVINKLPASMPSFDRISIIKRLKEELGDIDVNLSEIPWHLIMVNQSKIDSYIQELSSKHNFSYEHFLCPPVKYCIVEKCTSLKDSEKITRLPKLFYVPLLGCRQQVCFNIGADTATHVMDTTRMVLYNINFFMIIKEQTLKPPKYSTYKEVSWISGDNYLYTHK